MCCCQSGGWLWFLGHNWCHLSSTFSFLNYLHNSSSHKELTCWSTSQYLARGQLALGMNSTALGTVAVLLVPVQTRWSSPNPVFCDLTWPSTSLRVSMFSHKTWALHMISLCRGPQQHSLGTGVWHLTANITQSRSTCWLNTGHPRELALIPGTMERRDSTVNPWGGGAQLWGNALLQPNNCEWEETVELVMGTSGAVKGCSCPSPSAGRPLHASARQELLQAPCNGRGYGEHIWA